MGCSSFSKEKEPESFNIKNIGLTDKDYVDHLKSFQKTFISSPDVKTLLLSNQSENYLQSIAQEVTQKNELFFTSKEPVNFIIVQNKIPFHFSLPGRTIFLSTGLINKYIKSEKLLYCVIVFELIRIEKNLYNKVSIIPTGSLSLERILGSLRLKTQAKIEIHKWAFYLLKRAGIDTDNYLSWLQIQNRNSIDFSLQLGDINSISREESQFKSFLIKNSTKISSTTKYEGSSRDYYRFINSIKR